MRRLLARGASSAHRRWEINNRQSPTFLCLAILVLAYFTHILVAKMETTLSPIDRERLELWQGDHVAKLRTELLKLDPDMSMLDDAQLEGWGIRKLAPLDVLKEADAITGGSQFFQPFSFKGSLTELIEARRAGHHREWDPACRGEVFDKKKGYWSLCIGLSEATSRAEWCAEGFKYLNRGKKTDWRLIAFVGPAGAATSQDRLLTLRVGRSATTKRPTMTLTASAPLTLTTPSSAHTS